MAPVGPQRVRRRAVEADHVRQVRSHARAIERHGYKVTIEPLSPDPETGELPVTIAS